MRGLSRPGLAGKVKTDWLTKSDEETPLRKLAGRPRRLAGSKPAAQAGLLVDIPGACPLAATRGIVYGPCLFRAASMFWSLVVRRDVMVRAAKTAMCVGLLLIVINHGDALLTGQWSAGQLLKMLLTFAVPYCVSTYSSVGALQNNDKS